MGQRLQQRALCKFLSADTCASLKEAVAGYVPSERVLAEGIRRQRGHGEYRHPAPFKLDWRRRLWTR